MSNAEADDRWSKFVEPDIKAANRNTGRVATEKTKGLNEYLTRVLIQKPHRQIQEYLYKAATNLVKQVTDIAATVNTDWRVYTNRNKNGVVTAPLRTLAKGKYECMVPLVRPMRLDAFKVVQKSLDEMPQHRCLIQLNPALCREETQLMRRDWDPFISGDGYLAPKAILSWFNRGLASAVPILLSENHNVDKLASSVSDDGTTTLNATVSDFDGDELKISVLSVNINPVFVLDALPTSLKLAAPLPIFGNYIQGQKDFRRLVQADMEDGKHIAFLDPKFEPNPIRRCLTKEGPSWRINLSFTELHVYSIIDTYCRGHNFRLVLVLMNILSEENPELSALNNDILVNTLFNVSQKNIHKIHTKDEWIFVTMQMLCDGLKNKFVPSFYLPRMNLLDTYGLRGDKRKKAFEKLSEIIQELRSNPRSIFRYTGCVETKPKRKVTVDSKTSPDAQIGEHGDIVNETENDTENGTANDENLNNYEDNVEDETHDQLLELPDELLYRLPSPPQHHQEETSDISRLTKQGDRSDIY